MSDDELTERDAELLRAFAHAWTTVKGSREPFTLPAGGVFAHPSWPAGVRAPDRDEVRRLHHRGYLEADRAAAPDWVVFPTAAALDFAGHLHAAEEAALADPEERLATILRAVVGAHQSDPSEPLYLNEMRQADLVMDDRWTLQHLGGNRRAHRRPRSRFADPRLGGAPPCRRRRGGGRR